MTCLPYGVRLSAAVAKAKRPIKAEADIVTAGAREREFVELTDGSWTATASPPNVRRQRRSARQSRGTAGVGQSCLRFDMPLS